MEGDLKVTDARSKLWCGEEKKGPVHKAHGLFGGFYTHEGRESPEVCAAAPVARRAPMLSDSHH